MILLIFFGHFSGDPPREECEGGLAPCSLGLAGSDFFSVWPSAIPFLACAVQCGVVCLPVASFPALCKYFVV